MLMCVLYQVRGNSNENDCEIMRALLCNSTEFHPAGGEGEEEEDMLQLTLNVGSLQTTTKSMSMSTTSSLSCQLLAGMATEEVRRAYERARDKVVVMALLLTVSPSEGPLALSPQVRRTPHPLMLTHPLILTHPHLLTHPLILHTLSC